jgi:hypothetical protein
VNDPARYENVTVRLADLVAEEPVVRRTEFHGCTILGPAVIVPVGQTRFEGTTFLGDADSLSWEIDPARATAVGAILVDSCTFELCTFDGVGVAGPRELLDRFRAQVLSPRGPPD